LWQRGLHPIVDIRRNMKNDLLPLLDKIPLRKRFMVEPLFDKRESGMGLEHRRHRSPTDAFVRILSCIAAYGPTVWRGRRSKWENSGIIYLSNISP